MHKYFSKAEKSWIHYSVHIYQCMSYVCICTFIYLYINVSVYHVNCTYLFRFCLLKVFIMQLHKITINILSFLHHIEIIVKVAVYDRLEGKLNVFTWAIGKTKSNKKTLKNINVHQRPWKGPKDLDVSMVKVDFLVKRILSVL